MGNTSVFISVIDKLNIPSDITKDAYDNLMIKELDTFYKNRFGDIWCCGMFDNIERAREVVLTNETDIQEGCYQFAIIEEYTCGLYPHMINFEVYKWNKEKECFESYESPLDIKFFQGISFHNP